MSVQRTLLIVKPDAVSARHAGPILGMLENEGGFRLVAMRLEQLTEVSAQKFYAVHRERPFYADLVKFMCSGPCIPMVLERENAIDALRDFIGATNPAQARPGSIRQKFGANIQNNAVHASDSPASAASEIPHFFPEVSVQAR